MMFWLFLLAMSAFAVAGVVWPYLKFRTASSSGTEIAVYRDQLDEIARDLDLGLIGQPEAEAARIEISRRILAAVDHGDAPPRAAPAFAHGRLVAGLSAILLTLGSGGLYLRLGTPSMATEQPPGIAAAATPDGSVDRLLSQVEGYLNQNPRDARGWEVLAPVYMQTGRYGDAANAWRNVLQLSGESAERLSNLGEALVAEANGIVTAEAQSSFSRARALDPTTVSARYYLGMAAQQDGRVDEAAALYRGLLADAPAGAHWKAQVQAALTKLEHPPDAAAPPASLAGTGGDQQAMIRSMVERLAARLAADGLDPEGWARLVRSYTVLEQPDKAQDATASARRVLAGDAQKLATFESLLKDQDGQTQDRAPGLSPVAGPAPGDHDLEAMVVRLASRLKDSGSSPEGWLMLTRSYLTLGQREKAAAAIKDARKALASEPDKLDQYNEALRRFNVEGGGPVK